MSRIISCDPARPDRTVVAEIARALAGRKAVVLPTETQYGLAVAVDERTRETICRIKRRAQDLKTALFVKDMEMTARFCVISTMARYLAERFLPGPLTMVMPLIPGQTIIPDDLASEAGVGVRLSSSPLVAAVVRELNNPITATSANLSGQLTPETVEEIVAMLGEQVDLYVDGGPCRSIVPSTVAQVGERVTILRPGVIPETEIRRALMEYARWDG